MLCLLITLIHNQVWMCIDSNAYLGYCFFEVLACTANYSEIYCTLSDCEGTARRVQILYSRKYLKGHQSRKTTICWISQIISKSENMGRKPFKVFSGCGDDLFFTRIAKLVLSLGRGRSLGRENGGTHKESQRRPLKGEGFVLDTLADSSLCCPHSWYRQLLRIYFLFSSCSVAL